MKAIIIGGGIGGLCSALCLLKSGHQVQILEASSQISAVGAGIQLSPNAMHIMQALGIDNAVKSCAFRPVASQLRDGISGRVLMSSPMGSQMTAQYRAPYLHIHRAQFITILRDAILSYDKDAIKLDAQVTAYAQDKNIITALMADGTKVPGALLIGADGIKSIIARQILGSDYKEACFTSNMAWRATVPVSKLGRHVPPPAATVWMGQGKHAVTYLLGHSDQGQLANFVGVVEGDWPHEAWDLRGNRKEALSDFSGWHPIIKSLIEQADEHHKWALYDREPYPRWHDGRAVILGDAAHSMLPFLAQGAAMAIEDSYVLTQLLSENHIGQALSKFYAARIGRTSKMQNEARANMDVFHHGDGRSSARQSTLWLADKLTRHKAVNMKMDWIYGHDVTLPPG